ncbi:MAG: hypothetical protein MT490_16960 [Sphingomonas sp.]|uniref:hypothetical protein n=1 Tax=Sphingomonas sp. TaxID=28214 RepID=UPI002273A33E|nr:hypothetical protein [Sphingomonas sp.]MCX8477482.1 hypothetical protein [Sphingomonas sp.]
MAGTRKRIEALIDKLEKHGARVAGVELGDPMEASLPDLIAELGGVQPPPPLLDLYREIDGAALMWNLEHEGQALAGGFNLQEIRVAMLRNGAEADSEPLEGILWTGDEEPDRVELLRKMVIFDSVPGRNDFLTFLIDDPAQLYLIADGEPAKLHSSLDETLDVLIEHGGADSLRVHLTHTDWRGRVAADPELEAIRKL